MINEAVIDSLDFASLPPGCFTGLEQRCFNSEDEPEEFSCSDIEISTEIASKVLAESSPKLAGYLKDLISFKSTQFNTSSIHNAKCQNSTEISWNEVIEVYSESGSIIIEIHPTFTSVALLQLRTTSFGTSSVQFACYYANGAALEFSSIVGGIVSGYTISQRNYDCEKFNTLEDVGNSTSTANLTAKTSTQNEYYDLPDSVGLTIEYLIVCIYIVLSYLAAFKAYRLHQKQRTRTDFKTNINLLFIILFLVWATGNLVYMILLSAALTDSNFFYIKSVLTLTYFATYLGFTLIVHYRYRLMFSLL
jgi:hypothetical protein